MTDYSELLRRLQRNALRIDHGINELCGSAATAIETLTRELAEVQHA